MKLGAIGPGAQSGMLARLWSSSRCSHPSSSTAAGFMKVILPVRLMAQTPSPILDVIAASRSLWSAPS